MNVAIVIVTFILIAVIVWITASHSTPEYIGKDGERKVSTALANLPKEYHVVDDVIIPRETGTTQIDHLIFSRYGIFVIETKNYSGWISGFEKADNWKESFGINSEYFSNPIKQNWGHVYALSELLGLSKKVFIPIVVFSNDATLKVTSTLPVIYMRDLTRVVCSYKQLLLTDEQVNRALYTLKRFEIKTEDADNQHVSTVRANLAFAKKEIENGLCPRCDGKLVLRTGKYGQFYGCSNYPKCKYTRKM